MIRDVLLKTQALSGVPTGSREEQWVRQRTLLARLLLSDPDSVAYLYYLATNRLAATAKEYANALSAAIVAAEGSLRQPPTLAPPPPPPTSSSQEALEAGLSGTLTWLQTARRKYRSDLSDQVRGSDAGVAWRAAMASAAKLARVVRDSLPGIQQAPSIPDTVARSIVLASQPGGSSPTDAIRQAAVLLQFGKELSFSVRLGPDFPKGVTLRGQGTSWSLFKGGAPYLAAKTYLQPGDIVRLGDGGTTRVASVTQLGFVTESSGTPISIHPPYLEGLAELNTAALAWQPALPQDPLPSDAPRMARHVERLSLEALRYGEITSTAQTALRALGVSYAEPADSVSTICGAYTPPSTRVHRDAWRSFLQALQDGGWLRARDTLLRAEVGRVLNYTADDASYPQSLGGML